ncbi:hypothetical protein KM043_003199 [Ampulex compressa]|nr:hypothetical protein KM043_003199 [Ampulex compressa]
MPKIDWKKNSIGKVNRRGPELVEVHRAPAASWSIQFPAIPPIGSFLLLAARATHLGALEEAAAPGWKCEEGLEALEIVSIAALSLSRASEKHSLSRQAEGERDMWPLSGMPRRLERPEPPEDSALGCEPPSE